MMVTVITNGYLLTPDRIKRLNHAGLDHLQISIDNVQPDDVSKKSLKVLDRKLRMDGRARHFNVTINSVVGGEIRAARGRAFRSRGAPRELGFSPRSAFFMIDAANCCRS